MIEGGRRLPRLNALSAAKSRGVSVRMVLDRTQLRLNKRLAELTENIRVKRPGPIMHLKAYSIDGAILRTGSANLSQSGLQLQDNDLIIDRDASQVAAFDHRFEEMWSIAEPLSDLR